LKVWLQADARVLRHGSKLSIGIIETQTTSGTNECPASANDAPVSIHQWIDRIELGKSLKIAICGPQLPNSVGDANGSNSCVVHRCARNSGFGNKLEENREMIYCLAHEMQ
jgi:hypothetical protein